tara:strand:- start:99 stop:521 length:423 start_codon:yes stop_codon:yes gene_type:complete
MKQYFTKINVETNGQKLYEITDSVSQVLNKQDIVEGMLTLYIKHTSASLLIQENADNSVLRDLERFFNNLAPQNLDLYEHKAEGRDDMPAHIKSSLTSTHLTVPIRNKKIELGTWQGIFLFEHRLHSHVRVIDIHIIGTH